MPSEIKGSSNFDSDSAGKVLQVVSISKTDTFSNSTSGWSDITGLSATITPTLSTSKILVLSQITIGTDSGNIWALRLLRDATLINMGDASGTYGRGIKNASFRETNSEENVSVSFLDSPATTSAVTYKIQCNTENGYTIYLNRPAGTLADDRHIRAASNIILMEIGA